MKDAFTTDDYLNAIRREQAKRATTYPKIIAKMGKRGENTGPVIWEQIKQNTTLKRVYELVDDQIPIDADSARCYLAELIRELKMRKSYYPRLIYLDRNRKNPRMTKEIADYELAVWESLTRWFANEFLGLDELPTKRRKRQ